MQNPMIPVREAGMPASAIRAMAASTSSSTPSAVIFPAWARPSSMSVYPRDGSPVRWNRWGATASQPASASRRQMSSMWSLTPKISWITTTPPFGSPSGACTESGMLSVMTPTVGQPTKAMSRLVGTVVTTSPVEASRTMTASYVVPGTPPDGA